MIIQTIHMKSVTAEGMGTLSVFEAGRDVPFEVKRIYYIYGAPQGVQRGGHAHKALRQLLWCPYGSILIRLDDGREKTEVLLDDPAKGLVVEHFMWREMIWQQNDSVLCVAADSYYDADDYIRDYDVFLQAARGEAADRV
ncbi:MAG TPA: FdtA/QdtA family cupin domain-containing protein [Candidatus Gemmiger excrementipullorum]|uniref:FdtA/QdtA family cupin domain-containing protein n=2 Tax=Candidatus Gemmiger excrementipullorum TaxID=2838610 RepID=A0A9D1Y1K1_9FIRM|nr:FdtA/QdtA family cupin domain-containing protein [Candidatus Gemmiger excrementipullorum]